MIARVKKNDTVVVLSGKDKGKQGAVLSVDPINQKAIVKGVAITIRHLKAKRQDEKGGIKKSEGSVKLSILMPVCSSCKKACRVNAKELADGKKARICNKCKEVF